MICSLSSSFLVSWSCDVVVRQLRALSLPGASLSISIAGLSQSQASSRGLDKICWWPLVPHPLWCLYTRLKRRMMCSKNYGPWSLCVDVYRKVIFIWHLLPVTETKQCLLPRVVPSIPFLCCSLYVLMVLVTQTLGGRILSCVCLPGQAAPVRGQVRHCLKQPPMAFFFDGDQWLVVCLLRSKSTTGLQFSYKFHMRKNTISIDLNYVYFKKKSSLFCITSVKVVQKE